MLPDKIALDIVTVERRVLTEEVDEVVIPGSAGYLGVRPGHTPLMTGLGTGILTWWRRGQEHTVAVSLGYAEVLPDHVSVLAETAETAHEIEVDRAMASKERAERRLAQLGNAEIDLARARQALARAESRLRAVPPR